MCSLCASFRPFDPECPYRAPEINPVPEHGTSLSSSLPFYTYDQIAEQLTSNFWGGTSYAFDIGPDRTLSVDLAGLTQDGQEMARLALRAWSDASGIVFREPVLSGPSSTVTETSDSSAGGGTAYAFEFGQELLGFLVSHREVDWVAVTF